MNVCEFIVGMPGTRTSLGGGGGESVPINRDPSKQEPEEGRVLPWPINRTKDKAVRSSEAWVAGREQSALILDNEKCHR